MRERHLHVRVVIPTLNEAGLVGGALRALHDQQPPWEAVVVDADSTDGTAAVCRDHGVAVIPGPPVRGKQFHTGATVTTGTEPDVLLFLHADSVLPAGALQAARTALREPTVVGGKFRVRFDWRHPVLGLLGWTSRFAHPWASYGDQAFFLRRSTYVSMGGYEPIPLFDDVRFYKRMRAMGRVAVLPLTVTTSARRFRERGVWRQLALNARLIVRHARGADPRQLRREYEAGSPRQQIQGAQPESDLVEVSE